MEQRKNNHFLPFSWLLYAVLLVAAVYLFSQDKTIPEQHEVSENASILASPTTRTRDQTFSLMRQSGDAVLVKDHPAGTQVVTVSLALFSRPGFVVIYKNSDGVPNQIIGLSDQLVDGAEQFEIRLQEPLVLGEAYFAVLHTDVDKDGVFIPAIDQQTTDKEGNVVLMTFAAISESVSGF